jgi:hypothetical protein
MATPSPIRPSAGLTIHSSDPAHAACRGSHVSGSSRRQVAIGVRSASHTSGSRFVWVRIAVAGLLNAVRPPA